MNDITLTVKSQKTHEVYLSNDQVIEAVCLYLKTKGIEFPPSYYSIYKNPHGTFKFSATEK